jgi:hypothetical protein
VNNYVKNPKRVVRDRIKKINDMSYLQIVEYLTKKGIKGQRLQGCACPIHNYLARNVDPDVLHIEVNDGAFIVTDPYRDTTDMFDHSYRASWEWSSSVEDFITEFDLGIYPHLEEKVNV